jgi:hypothetical protein
MKSLEKRLRHMESIMIRRDTQALADRGYQVRQAVLARMSECELDQLREFCRARYRGEKPTPEQQVVAVQFALAVRAEKQ